MRDKTQDDRYFILTLFPIAKELEKKRYPSPVVSVDLAVGLPPEHYGTNLFILWQHRTIRLRRLLENMCPDFVVVAVDKSSLADVCIDWASRGYAVLSETPAGSNWEQLNKLWEMYTVKNAHIAVCEQYHRYPELTQSTSAKKRSPGDNPAFRLLGNGYKFFLDIELLQYGDDVYITNLWETLTYKVVEIKIIKPNDVNSILIQKDRDLVTLLICHTYGSCGLYRYLVS